MSVPKSPCRGVAAQSCGHPFARVSLHVGLLGRAPGETEWWRSLGGPLVFLGGLWPSSSFGISCVVCRTMVSVYIVCQEEPTVANTGSGATCGMMWNPIQGDKEDCALWMERAKAPSQELLAFNGVGLVTRWGGRSLRGACHTDAKKKNRQRSVTLQFVSPEKVRMLRNVSFQRASSASSAFLRQGIVARGAHTVSLVAFFSGSQFRDPLTSKSRSNITTSPDVVSSHYVCLVLFFLPI